MTKAEVENRLMNEIHYLPIEIIEEMLRWALVIKKIALPESIASPNNIDKRKKISVHTFHGDGLKPGINLNNSSELQNILRKVKPLKRQAGLGGGKFWMSEDFDEPLPDEFWLGDE